jgi:hypothetical protein
MQTLPTERIRTSRQVNAMSPVGTFRTSRDVRLESASGGRADMHRQCRLPVCFGACSPLGAGSQFAASLPA